ALADLACTVDQQVELVLAAVLDQHLRRPDHVGRWRFHRHEIDAALVPAIGPLDLILRAGRDRQAARPGGEGLAGSPAQLVTLAIGGADLDRRRSIALGPPQLDLRCIGHANLPALADVDVPDARIV